MKRSQTGFQQPWGRRPGLRPPLAVWCLRLPGPVTGGGAKSQTPSEEKGGGGASSSGALPARPRPGYHRRAYPEIGSHHPLTGPRPALLRIRRDPAPASNAYFPQYGQTAHAASYRLGVRGPQESSYTKFLVPERPLRNAKNHHLFGRAHQPGSCRNNGLRILRRPRPPQPTPGPWVKVPGTARR